MGLLELAPGVQEGLLSGDLQVSERELRPLVATADWTKQLALWDTLSWTALGAKLPSRIGSVIGYLTLRKEDGR